MLWDWQLLLQESRVNKWEDKKQNTVSVKVRHVGQTTTFLLQYLNNQERQAFIYSTSSFNHVSLFYNWSIAYLFFSDV